MFRISAQSPKLTAALLSLTGSLFSVSAFAKCDGIYNQLSDSNRKSAEALGVGVRNKDMRRHQKSFANKVFRHSVVPGLGLVYDLLTTTADEYDRYETKKELNEEEPLRLLAIELWRDQELILNLLRNAQYNAYGNRSFVRLYGDLVQAGFTGTREEVARRINAANWAGHFCLEKPYPVFYRNRFGRHYPSELRALFTYDDLKAAILTGAWQEELDGVPGSLPLVDRFVTRYPSEPGAVR